MRILEWQENLLGRYRPVTINAMLAALNSFFRFAGWGTLKYFFEDPAPIIPGFLQRTEP